MTSAHPSRSDGSGLVQISLSAAAEAAPAKGQGGCGRCGTCASDPSCESNPVLAQGRQPGSNSLLPSPDHVLSTLEKDGSRRWLWPKLSPGRFWSRRRWVGYALIAFFVALPHLRISGKPAFLIDIPARQLIVAGYTFLPTDTLLVAFGGISIFLTIMLSTALAGRVWCGWFCPQTVYMEFLFRPIDRLFEGTKGRGGAPRRSIIGPLAILRYVIYLILAMALAHTFLSYFVGTDRLAYWIQSSPAKHPLAFLVMTGTTVAMLFDFLFFREQLCLIACPYGRFQSVMLDRRSLIVGYDTKRGEPRGKLAKSKTTDGGSSEQAQKGDCVDCKMCVAVCPTGIDIRNGLQMECINCTQCIDACDSVMDKIGKPRGLIRYSSQDGLDGKPSSILRARTLMYPVLLAISFSAFLYVLSTKSSFDVTVIRGAGNPYTSIGIGRVQNSVKVRLVNRSDAPKVFQIAVSTPDGVAIEVIEPEKLALEPGKSSVVAVSLQFASSVLAGQGGRADAMIVVSDQTGKVKARSWQLLGPK